MNFFHDIPIHYPRWFVLREVEKQKEPYFFKNNLYSLFFMPNSFYFTSHTTIDFYGAFLVMLGRGFFKPQQPLFNL